MKDNLTKNVSDKAQSPAFLVAVISRFLLPNHFLSKHERKTATGRIYWTANDKNVFCRTYLNLDYKALDKHPLHFFMYARRGGFTFNYIGLPVWEYTEKPIIWEFQNCL